MSTQTNQIVPFQKKVADVRALLEKSKSQIAMALPKHINPDRMLRVAMTCIQRTPKLLECTQTSLLGAIMQSAQLGLEPDGLLGEAYLVPYKNQVQLIPGYRGLMKLARRSGEISTIYAMDVHEKDHFIFSYGLGPKLEHTPSADEDPGAIVAFYAVARLKDGGSQFVVMWRSQVDQVRKRSKAANDGPWVTDYAEMGKKTCVRRLCKYLPSSVELQAAVSLDERSEAGIAQDLGDVIDVSGLPEASDAPTPSKLDQVVDKAKPQDKPMEPKDPSQHPSFGTEDETDKLFK